MGPDSNGEGRRAGIIGAPMTRDGAAGPGEAPLLTVRSLSIAFGETLVVDGISFDVARGEIVALVGESGSGKTVTALSLLDLVPEPGRRTAGEVVFEGRDVASLAPAELRRLRGGGIGFVFQEPGEALDPVRTIGSELVAVLRRLPRLQSRSAPRARVVDALLAGAVGAVMTGLVLAVHAEPLRSRLAPFFRESSLVLAKGRNVVNVILVDFRGLDTLGEITVLGVAALGVWSLVRLRLASRGAGAKGGRP